MSLRDDIDITESVFRQGTKLGQTESLAIDSLYDIRK